MDLPRFEASLQESVCRMRAALQADADDMLEKREYPVPSMHMCDAYLSDC